MTATNAQHSRRWKLAETQEYRRPRAPYQYESLIDDLVDEDIFETKAAAMLFAAALGRKYSERKPIEKKGTDVRWSPFGEEGLAFVNALALAESNDVAGLDPQKDDVDVVTIFEEYMNGGFEYLEQTVLRRPGERLENLLAVLQEARLSSGDVPSGLEGFDPSALQLLGDLDD